MMHRCYQLLFASSLIALSWYGMMTVHEVGHVIGALASGGTVGRVVLHPFAISRTDVAPNPWPGTVAWLGPIVGCVAPLTFATLMPRRMVLLRKTAQFFAGFCLIANGAYLAIGSFAAVGDCGEMLRAGTPHWAMIAFGMITVPLGLLMWHRLGSLGAFLRDPAIVTPKAAYAISALLLTAMVAGFALSPR